MRRTNPEKPKEQEIELRCEEVQDILTRPPHALVRWGITVLFAVLALLFIGGCFFKYPDVVSASITITTEHPPVWMVARSTGKIKKVYRKDRDSIVAGDIVAVLENPAETKDVLLLESLLANYTATDSSVAKQRFPENLELGELQSSYATFMKGLTSYRNFLLLNLYQEKMEATQRELEEYHRYIVHLKRQEELDKEQMRVATVVYNREKILLNEGLIAQSVYEEAQMTFLSKQQNSEQLKTSLSSAKIQEAQLRQAIIESEMERNREANNLQTALQSACSELQASIKTWKLHYLLVSPANGILSYNNIWQRNQDVNSGDKVFSVVTQEPGRIIGKMKLTTEGAGKVKQGQRVSINVSNYPYMEFGSLTGEVCSISLLPDEENAYMITISLPQELRTSYGKILNFRGELSGMAEVMTDERSVTSRLFSPLRHLFSKCN